MTGLSCEIKKKLLTLNQIADAVFIANVRNIYAQLVLDAFNIEQVASIFRNEAVYERYFGAEVHQPSCQVGTDESKSSGNQNPSALE